MKIRNVVLDFKISTFIRQFIVADMLLFGGWGFVDPIFSIFIVKEIVGATVVTVGIIAAIHWFLKSTIQIPVAMFLDKTDGERDDFYTLIASLVIVALAAFALIFATRVWHLYAIQLIKAIGFGLYVPSWSALFSRHLDRGHYSLDWSLDSTSVGYSMGVSGLIGGIIVTWLGYQAVFMAAGIFSLLSAVLLLSVPHLVFPSKTGHKPFIKDHTPVNINQ